MKRYACQKCGKDFKSDLSIMDLRCIYCGSVKLKKQSSIPDKSYIRDFLLYETKKCRECGRPLKSEKSIKRGFGPTCGAYYAEKWFDNHPTDLGDRARKIWTKEEIEALVKFATAKENIGRAM